MKENFKFYAAACPLCVWVQFFFCSGIFFTVVCGSDQQPFASENCEVGLMLWGLIFAIVLQQFESNIVIIWPTIGPTYLSAESCTCVHSLKNKGRAFHNSWISIFSLIILEIQNIWEFANELQETAILRSMWKKVVLFWDHYSQFV